MNLLRILRKNEDSRKVFGKREIKIIEKQLYGINLTQSEKNRLSRDIRKKLDFISKIIKFEDEFKLKKGAIIKELIEDSKTEILKSDLRKKIKEIWLFGSSVDNQLTFRSDIDIAVLFDKITLKDATKFRVKVQANLPDKVDIQVFNVLPKKIKKSLLNKYKVLYRKDE